MAAAANLLHCAPIAGASPTLPTPRALWGIRQEQIERTNMSNKIRAAGIGLALAATSLPSLALAENRIDRIRPDAPELAAFGAYPIGVQTLEFTNPGQHDILNTTDAAQPLYDRDITVEVWYPAAVGTEAGGSYQAILRDGKTEVTLTGRAARDAPPASGERFPMVVISHGYPGNRYLLSHLGENLAPRAMSPSRLITATAPIQIRLPLALPC
jgi:hypothetical protein